MTAPATAPPRLYRRPGEAVLGGVAAGIAAHVGLPLRTVRVLFVLLAFAGGLGVALYAAYWIVLPSAPDSGSGRMPQWLEYLVAGLAAVAAIAVTVTALPTGALFGPVLVACIGGALIWRQAAEPQRDRLWGLSRSSLSAGSADRMGRVRLAVGVVLVLAAAVFVLARADVTAARDGLIAVMVAVVGLALLTGPWWMRMVSQLTEERAERIRSQERADIAAHLHDSVLQTLALIQRNADSPREVARLARGQERELRSILYDSRAAAGQLGDQLRQIAAEVEDAYAISVDVVIVGDAPLDEPLAAMAAAAREALVNAAKHSQSTAVSLYAEVEPELVSVFVKDRGVGFDLSEVGADRQGIRGSIVGRMERAGGTARVTSTPAEGTEVELRLDQASDR